QCIVAGLAVAFAVVMARPELVNLHRGAAPEPSTYAAAVAASSPAVVNIYTTQLRVDPFGRPAIDAFVRPVYREMLGSGVVISPEGYIVTNFHVIQAAAEVRVQLADGRIATPVLVGADEDTE